MSTVNKVIVGQTSNVQATARTSEVKGMSENPFNLVRVSNAENVPQESAWVGLPFRVATAGYSAAPEGYEAPTQLFVNALVNELGGAGKVGLVTSPTADKGSIDAISTIAAHGARLPIKYVTSEGYVQYINPDNFPKEGIDNNRYKAEAKYVLPENDEYSRATSVVSNSFLATGGRDATVGDFVNAIKRGNKVVILDNKLVKADVWDAKKNRPNNASAYLAQKLAGDTTLPLIPGKGFTQEFVDQNKEAIARLVKIVTVANEADINKAAKEAAAFLSS